MQRAKGRAPLQNNVRKCFVFLNQIKWNENKMLVCVLLLTLSSTLKVSLSFILDGHKWAIPVHWFVCGKQMTCNLVCV